MHRIMNFVYIYMINMICCTAKCQKWTTFSLAGVFVILGILLVILWDLCLLGWFHGYVNHELSLSNNKTKGYNMWKETPVPMYLQFYLFNWTNPHEIKNASSKPNFIEHGPYTYYEHHIRENITFNNNNTVTFYTKRVWTFLPEQSVGSLDDNITTLNPVVVTVGKIVKNKHVLVKKAVNFLLEEKKVKLAITKTVRQFIFDGYEDPMLDLVHKLNITGFHVPFSKFGWFAERNGSVTYDGIFNIFTGADDIQKLGVLNTWNYQNNISYLRDSCAKINGTTGEIWYPPGNNETVVLFTSDLCSSLELKRNGDYYVHGVVGNKYIGTKKIFDNGTLYPEMKCFVPEDISQQASGIRDVSQCKFGAPAFVSYAHFYLADPSYREAISGMNPSADKHQMFLVLEPNTGMPLKVEAKLQLNLKMEPVEDISLLTGIKSTIMPAFLVHADSNDV
ncbi:hypothetical protein NQ317_011310 [Molorchus minor]|uniref:Protein croquemort n=1 Tax=Molorchus minor TaxID=1323400 RepID=A0ABQ9IZ89_9CUCU|nr:hypothetical protein NQ317_011310 [Molorchus minor]